MKRDGKKRSDLTTVFVLMDTKYLLFEKLCWLTEMLQSTTEKIFKQK
jgi:hypothetical protein